MIRPIDYHKLLWHCVLSLRKDILYSSKYTKISNNLLLFDDDRTLIYCNDITEPTNMYATHWFHINKEIYTLTLQFAFTFYAGVKSICLTYEWWYVSCHFMLSPLISSTKMIWAFRLICNVSPNIFVMQNLSPFLTSSNNGNIWRLKKFLKLEWARIKVV